MMFEMYIIVILRLVNSLFSNVRLVVSRVLMGRYTVGFHIYSSKA